VARSNILRALLHGLLLCRTMGPSSVVEIGRSTDLSNNRSVGRSALAYNHMFVEV